MISSVLLRTERGICLGTLRKVLGGSLIPGGWRPRTFKGFEGRVEKKKKSQLWRKIVLWGFGIFLKENLVFSLRDPDSYLLWGDMQKNRRSQSALSRTSGGKDQESRLWERHGMEVWSEPDGNMVGQKLSIHEVPQAVHNTHCTDFMQALRREVSSLSPALIPCAGSKFCGHRLLFLASVSWLPAWSSPVGHSPGMKEEGGQKQGKLRGEGTTARRTVMEGAGSRIVFVTLSLKKTLKLVLSISPCFLAFNLGSRCGLDTLLIIKACWSILGIACWGVCHSVSPRSKSVSLSLEQHSFQAKY